MRRLLCGAAVLSTWMACGGWDDLADQSTRARCLAHPEECDAGVPVGDAGAVDAGAVDAGAVDAGAVDAGPVDAGPVDAGAGDAGAGDAGEVDAGVDAGVMPLIACASSADCVTSEACHPTARVCLPTCNGPDAGCSSCDFPPGYNTGPRFCACTVGNCPGSSVCSPFDGVCTLGCLDNLCPQGRSCETNNTCAPPAPCEFGACSAPLVCSGTTLLCSQLVCDANAPAPSGCGYGTFCGGSGQCEEVPQATCPNFTSSGLTWGSQSLGPVIFQGTERGFASDSSFCSPGTYAFSFVLRAYTDGGWPTAKDSLSLLYYRQDGTNLSATTLMRNSNYVVDGGVATLQVTLCPNASTPFSAGFVFPGGNPFCVEGTMGAQAP